jgi:subtilisin-like proprotein convertase family protein
MSFRTVQNVQPNYAATDLPVSVPDNNPTGATSTLNIVDSRVIQDINVNVNLTHTYDGDLVLSLITPTNASITLSNRNGSGGDNFTNTTFDDEATTPIAAGSPPYTGSFRPDSALSGADSLPGTGAWKLKVTDLASLDTGTINSWSLTLTFPSQTCPGIPTPPPVPDGTTGQGMRATRTNPSGSAVHLTWDVSTCTASNYHLLYGSLSSVATHVLAGGVCGLGPLGVYDWSGLPGGNIWWLVVSDDSAGKEGSWGKDGSGAPIGGTTPSNLCGNSSRTNSGTCP